jgi:CotH kinase protein/Lamin Tail Domain/Secretion system C-terminal sorting domain/Chitobiase/beta-hexosaminidase C-terminal domain/Divergent InlB B-repeat domain
MQKTVKIGRLNFRLNQEPFVIWVFFCNFRIQIMRYSTLLFLLSFSHLSYGQIKLNEASNANTGQVTNPDDSKPDWIELYNTQSGSVNLQGYSLSDDRTQLNKWVFPFRSLSGNSYELIQASGKSSLTGNLATNFNINGKGETIYLSDPSGLLVDSIEVPDLAASHSFGSEVNGNDTKVIFANPTPGTSNNPAIAYSGYEIIPTIETNGGVFPSSLIVSVVNHSQTNGQVHYTLDGQNPTSSSSIYTGPITISGNTVLRVRCFSSLTSLLPSWIATETYLINEDYSIPIVSISMDDNDLYGPTGIFDNPYTDWKRACVVEYFDKDGVKKFESRASVKPDGGAGGSRGNPQHSVTIEPANSVYGDGEAIPIAWLPEKPHVQSLSAFYLRNGSNFWNVYPQKDATMLRVVNGSNVEYQGYTPVVAYLNGVYFGVYEMREKANESYFENNYGNDPDSLDLLSISYFYGPSIVRTVKGSDSSFWAMHDFITSYPPLNVDFYAKCHEKLDLENFTDYLIAEIWMGNYDWIYNNMKMARMQTAGNKWRFWLQDIELGLCGWSDENSDLLGHLRYGNLPNPFNEIYLALLENKTFKNNFINRFADMMNTYFTPGQFTPIVNEMYQELLPEMPRHFQLWTGDVPGGMSTYLGTKNCLLNQFTARSPVVRNQLLNDFGLSNSAEITLETVPVGAGKIKISTIVPETLPWTGVYFNGVPVEITVLPNPGYTFTAWQANGTILPSELSNPHLASVLVSSNTTFTALFTGAQAEFPLKITEVSYHQDISQPSGDWFEIENAGETDINLAGYKVLGKVPYYDLELPNLLVEPNQRVVIAENLESFTSFYAQPIDAIGDFKIGLRNDADSIRIATMSDEVLLRVAYSDTFPDPICADGFGYTLEAYETSGSDNSAWFCGCLKGSPGSPYSPCANDIWISEFQYNNAQLENVGDWFEIYNSSDQAISLNGFVMRDRSDLNSYILPNYLLEPKSYLVFGNNKNLFDKRYKNKGYAFFELPFALGKSDAIRLYDPTGNLVSSVAYEQPTFADLELYGDYTMEFNWPQIPRLPSHYQNWFVGCETGSPGSAYRPCLTLPDGEEELVYPNPVSNELNVLYTNSTIGSTEISISIHDMQGKTVAVYEVDNIGTYAKVTLDVSALAHGIYQLRLQKSDGTVVKPFVKI